MMIPLVLAAAASAAQPASVKAGVELWRSGDYAAAVAAWLPFANAGDADACFNMGQAYKLGRGVPKDASLARDYYRKAATKGHLPATANLGIALFQAGDKLEAVKWLRQAADRGEPRAQYVLGIAAYNGDGTPKNLGLAYGYLLRAQASGLAQATTALGSIEPVLTPDARSTGQQIAASIAAGNGVPAALAGAAPARSGPAGVQRPPAPVPGVVANVTSSVRTALGLAPVTKPPVPSTVPAAVPSVAKPTDGTALPPRAAVTRAPATAVTGDGIVVALPRTAPPAASAAPPPRVATVVGSDPTRAAAAPAVTPPLASFGPQKPNPAAIAETTVPAGASEARPAEPAVASATPPEPSPRAGPEPKPAKAATRPAKVDIASIPEPKPAGWRVQLGAFSSRKQAEAAWAGVKTSKAIGKAKPIFEPQGSVVKFQLGPFASQTAARDACAKLAFAGKACFVTGG